ncbi:MAG: RluA family pseudouridine synthase [Saccharofermentanales bacterium]|nr:RluA family pseudouridine synthase [Clostridiaceae bacterium]
MVLKIVIDQSDQRLDSYLAGKLPQYSRSYLQKLISRDLVLLDGNPVKASWKTTLGETISLTLPDPEPMTIKAENIPLDIVFEDRWLLVVNKPQGMVVHPAAGHHSGTLVNALLDHCQDDLSDLNGVVRPGIVHRIDKDTSGLILVVKNNQVHAALAERLRRHEIKRTYQAVVHGNPGSDRGTIDAPIGRDPRNRKRMAIVADGKPAVSHFTVKTRFAAGAWLEVQLETGRTHQIRVHMQYIGHPIIGDRLYAGGRKHYHLEGQALHAGSLEFAHPVTGEQIRARCELPDHFRKLLEKLS